MADGVVWDDEVQWDEPATAPPTAPATAAAPAQSTVGRLYQQYVAEPGRRFFQGPANNLARAPYEILTGQRPLLTGLQAPAEYQTTPTGPWEQVGAELLNPVPPDLASLGAQVGTLGAAGKVDRLARVGLGAVGAGLGSALQGDPAAKQLQQAGTAGLVSGLIETGSAGLSKLLRALPNNPLVGGKANIAASDAATYGGRMGEAIPDLAGATTAGELRDIASGPGLAKLRAMKERAVRQIEQLPGIAANPTFPVQGTPMTLRDANDVLSDIGARAFSRNPLDRTFNGIDQRQLYHDVAREIEQGLATNDSSGLALPIFQKAQELYKGGIGYLNPLKSPQAFRNYSDQLQFNTPYFQKILGSPRGEANLRVKLGNAEFERLRDALLRGGGAGTTDVLPGAAGGWSDALTQLARSGGGAGTTLLAPLRTALPNLGARYAGQAPYTLGSLPQRLLDVSGLDVLQNLGR